MLTHELVDEPLEGFDNLASPRLDDFLVILSPDGEELRRSADLSRRGVGVPPICSTTFLLRGSRSAAHQHRRTDHRGDGAKLRFRAAGQVLLSFRELGAIGVLDLDREDLVFALHGYWLGQHDPDILPNGHLLLFDNIGNFEKPEGRSRVIEFYLKTMAIVWQYAGTAQAPLESKIRADQQRLTNGNTLITESNGGWIPQVMPDRRDRLAVRQPGPQRRGRERMLIILLGAAPSTRPSSDTALWRGQPAAVRLQRRSCRRVKRQRVAQSRAVTADQVSRQSATKVSSAFVACAYSQCRRNVVQFGVGRVQLAGRLVRRIGPEKKKITSVAATSKKASSGSK